jgi:hypothetical protein
MRHARPFSHCFALLSRVSRGAQQVRLFVLQCRAWPVGEGHVSVRGAQGRRLGPIYMPALHGPVGNVQPRRWIEVPFRGVGRRAAACFLGGPLLGTLT